MIRIPIIKINILGDKELAKLKQQAQEGNQKAVDEQRRLNNGIIKNLLQHNADLLFQLNPTIAPKMNYHANAPSLTRLMKKTFLEKVMTSKFTSVED